MRGCRTAAAFGLLLTACADEGGSEGDASSTAAEATGPASAASTDSGPTSEASSSGSTAPTSSESSGATDTDASSSSGTDPSVVELANDSWVDGTSAAFQGGFVQDECWASTYVPDAEQYPFTIRGVQMIVGGEDMGDAEFEVGLWEVDEDNRPSTPIDSGTALLSGFDDNWDGLILEALMIDPLVVEEGNFAWVVCLVAHDGLPAIANDTDGAAEDRNWIYTIDGEWLQSSGLGVSGDWIMRATIEPM